MISCPQNCQKHESVSSEQRILLVQKYHTRKDLVASLLSLNKALILDPLASNEQKKTRTDQLSVLRKLAKTAAAEYLQSLVRFQYGEEVWDVLPDTPTFSLVPPEMKKKLESLQKATKKAKADAGEREMKQDNSYKYRDSYGTGSNRFRASKRYSPYPGGFNNYNQQSPNYGFSDHHNVQGAYLPQAAPPGWAMPGQPSTPTYNINPSGGPYSTGTPNPGRGFNPYGNFFPPDGSTNPFQPSTWYQGPLHSTQARQDSRDVQERKKTSKCGRCDQFGHWYGDNMCDPMDVARKLAKLQAKDPQTHAAAEITALGLIHQPNLGQYQGN